MLIIEISIENEDNKDNNTAYKKLHILSSKSSVMIRNIKTDL